MAGTRSSRTEKRRSKDLELICKIITDKFADKPFIMGDIYYLIYDIYTRSRFGQVRADIIKLSKEGFIRYEMGMRPSGKDGISRQGATFMYNKHEPEGIAIDGTDPKEDWIKVKL